MDNDIFEEVKHIEEEAERILADAANDRESALKAAEEEVDACREESERKLEAESRRLRTEHERTLAEKTASIQAEFDGRKRRLEQASASRTDELADWVADRFLADSAIVPILGTKAGRENR